MLAAPAARRLRVAPARAVGGHAVAPHAVNFWIALWLLAVLNVPFWRALWHGVGGWDASRAGYLLSLPLVVLAWVWLILECLTWGRAAKPVLAAILMLSAAAAYFQQAYGIVFDRTMIANIVATDPREARELFSPAFAAWLLAFGVAPAWLLWRVPLPRVSWRSHLLAKAMTLGVLLSAFAVLVAPFFQSYAALSRNHRALRLHLVPANYLGAMHGYARARFARAARTEIVAPDATRTSVDADRARHTLTVLVIGETARAANFALNGYGRPTTPQLAGERDLVNFRQVRSCGTSTAVSLPCMFLDVGRAEFRDALAADRENLLDVLQRAGYAVIWRDNNSGCKGLCERVTYEDVTQSGDPAFCAGANCYDEVLLQGLEERLRALQRDAVIVLHMKGSHGPAYYARYPASFEYFKPACKTNQFDRCDRASVVNAYDNTLRYSDYVLSRAIALMRRLDDRYDASLIYVSDHGESLGEHGLYLHGMPYALAPPEQTHVPMLMWFSQSTQRSLGIDAACLRRMQDAPISHDHLYHSMLGLLGVRTRIYRAERDVFRNCRAPRDEAPAVSASRSANKQQERIRKEKVRQGANVSRAGRHG